MTPAQREAAERLIDDRLTATMEWSRQVIALLHELLAADVAENATTEPYSVELPDDGELESWRQTADELLGAKTGGPSTHTLRRAAHLLQNAYLCAANYSKLHGESVQKPVQEPKPTTASQFESVKQAKRAAEYELRYYTKMMKEKNAAPQQPMRCPEDGGACGAGGYCRPQQRKPLTDDEALALIRATPQEDVTQEGWIRRQRLSWVRAIERAHGIGETP